MAASMHAQAERESRRAEQGQDEQGKGRRGRDGFRRWTMTLATLCRLR